LLGKESRAGALAVLRMDIEGGEYICDMYTPHALLPHLELGQLLGCGRGPAFGWPARPLQALDLLVLECHAPGS